MIEKIEKFVNGKLVAGLTLVSTLWWIWDAIANTLKSKKEIGKVLVVDQEGKENTDDKKTIDFQQVRKTSEKQENNMPAILRTNQGLKTYLDSHDRIPPYLKNWRVMSGKQLVDSLFTSDYDPFENEMYSFIRSGENIVLDLNDLPSNISINISEWKWIKKAGEENKYIIHEPILLLIEDKNEHGERWYWAVDVGSKLRTGEKILEHSDTLVVGESWTFIGKNETLVSKDSKLGAVKVEKWVQRFNYIDENWKNHHLDGFDDPITDVPISEILKYLRESGAQVKIQEKNWIRDSIYEIGLDCGSRYEFFPENINTPSWTLKVREAIQYCTINIKQWQWVEEAYLIDENGIMVDTTHVEKGQKVKLVAKSKADWKINEMTMNELPIEFEDGTGDKVISKDFLTISEGNTTFQVEAISTSGINWTEVKEPGISSENGTLTIDTQDTQLQSVQIYDLKGQLLEQRMNLQGIENFQLSQGLYLVKWRTVKGESKTAKVMVK